MILNFLANPLWSGRALSRNTLSWRGILYSFLSLKANMFLGKKKTWTIISGLYYLQVALNLPKNLWKLHFGSSLKRSFYVPENSEMSKTMTNVDKILRFLGKYLNFWPVSSKHHLKFQERQIPSLVGRFFSQGTRN